MAFTDRLHNRGSISTGYDIDNSLKVEADNSESLTRSAQDGGDRRIVTISFWTKRTELTSSYEMLILAGVNGSKYSSIGFQVDNTFDFHYYNGGSYEYSLRTDRIFRDTSAWYHIVVAMDTTQGTAANRIKIYINGVQETSFSTETYPTQNIDTPFNNDSQTYPIEIGNQSVFGIGGIPYSGYLADYYLVDGLQLEPTDFGKFDADSGIWKPKAYTGSYGTNGFYLDFSDSANLGDDASGNGNNFTLNNITSADQATDTPTNNFCTWLSNGQLFHPTSASDNPTFNEGGTRQLGNGGTGWVYAYATQAASSGKWYYEGIVGSAKNCMIGACPVSTTARPTNVYLGQESNSTVGFQYSDGNIFFYTGYTTWESGGLATGDIVGFAMDLDNGKAYVSRNGVWFDSANPATNYRGLTLGAMTQEPYMFAMARYNPNENNPFNFGGFTTISISTPESDENGYGNFEYAPPSGFYAMCTKNLAEYG